MNKFIKCGAIVAMLLFATTASADGTSYLYWMSEGAETYFGGKWTTAKVVYGPSDGGTVTGYLVPVSGDSYSSSQTIAGDFYGMQAKIGSTLLSSSYQFALELYNDQGILARSSWLAYDSAYIGGGSMSQAEAKFTFSEVPEPTSGLLVMLGVGLLALRRKQKKSLKQLVAAFALIGSTCAFAGIDDTSVIVSSVGPDTYADGTPVVDGEYYALCWSAGDFKGIQANGELMNSEDKILGIFPAAKDGKCRCFKYDLSADDFNKGGNITLWLLDSRVYAEDGTVSKAKLESSTKIAAVNGAVQVQASVTVASAGMAGVKASLAAKTVATELPEDAPKPTIKSIKVGEVYVEIEVENTVPYLAYDLKSGANPGKLESGAARNAANGKAGGTITLYAEKKDKAFFQVDRK